MDRQATIDATVATFGLKAAYTGSGATIGSWLLSSEFGILIGIVIGVLGLITNWYFQHKRDKREEKEHQRWMSQMATQPSDPP